MSGIIPDEGTCEGCGCHVEDEDGYVMIEDDGAPHRYCDECPQ